MLDGVGLRRDQPRQPAGGDDAAGVPELLLQAADQALDQARVAVDDARLHGVDGVAPDHARGQRDLHPRQARGPAEERLGADLHARRDHAAQVLALGRDAVEGGGGAEVDDDHRAMGPLEAGHRVDDPIGADLARVLVEDAHPRLDAGADHQRLAPEGGAHEPRHGVGEGGDHAGDDGVIDAAEIDAAEREHLPNQHGVLVGGARSRALAADVVQEAGALEDPEADVGVADVDDEEHGPRTLQHSHARGLDHLAVSTTTGPLASTRLGAAPAPRTVRLARKTSVPGRLRMGSGSS